MRGFPIVGRWRIFMSTRLSRRSRPLCTETTKNSSNKGNGVEKASTNEIDVYKQLENLDFITATKILFTEPPKKKKFGLDFHLVQLFFACMPSLAVYLVAQYARYEIRKMEAEEELKKKKAEEEERAKEVEESAMAEIEKLEANPELLDVKVRLDVLEETVKQIATETKKLSSGSNLTRDQDKTKKEQQNGTPSSESKLEERSSAPAMETNASHETTSSASAPLPSPPANAMQSDNGRIS